MQRDHDNSQLCIARVQGPSATLRCICRDDCTTVVHLEVACSNMAASQLYRCLGFRQTGCRKGYYSIGAGKVDAILMSCSLPVSLNWVFATCKCLPHLCPSCSRHRQL